MATSFNILGDCVSRDILQPGVAAGRFEVKQYVSFISPVSLFTGASPEKLAGVDTLNWGSNFARRNLALDLSKDAFEYLFAEPSDYLVLDILDARMSLMMNDEGATVTRSNILVKNPDQIEDFLGPDWHRVTANEIPLSEHIAAVEGICDRIGAHYAPSQVILNKHFAVPRYIRNSSAVVQFKAATWEGAERYNELARTLYGVVEERLAGCNVIEFPEGMLATNRNKWGLHPLHYSQSYYEYGTKAVDAIVAGIPGSPATQLELERLRWQTTLKLADFEHSLELRTQKATTRKLRTYYDIAEELLRGGHKLLDALGAAKGNTVALYGDFLVAGAIKEFLETNGYAVAYIISGWDNGTMRPVMPPSAESFPPADALVVCDVLAHGRVRERMARHFPLVLTVEEFHGA